jgi:hypothetical protein
MAWMLPAFTAIAEFNTSCPLSVASDHTVVRHCWLLAPTVTGIHLAKGPARFHARRLFAILAAPTGMLAFIQRIARLLFGSRTRDGAPDG